MKHARPLAALFLAIALTATGCGGGDGGGSQPPDPATAKPRLPESGSLQPAEVSQYQERSAPPIILDVRTAKEFETGHVPGAVNIPVQSLPTRLPELEAGREAGVIVYCRSGRRAKAAQGILENAGFSEVALIEGSMQAWENAKLPVEKPRR